jgi:polysaccharide export outer membrane protein
MKLPMFAAVMLAVLLAGSPFARAQEKPRGPEEKKTAQNSSGTTKNEGSTSGGAAQADAQSDPEVYRIGVEDELQISVWHEPELTMPVVVRPDGKITMPLINDVAVVGLRTEELQTLLMEKFKPFVNEPQVTVIARNIRSRKVYLVGQVIRPGSYPLVGRKTVVELIAEAGGMGPFAKDSRQLSEGDQGARRGQRSAVSRGHGRSSVKRFEGV